MYCRLAEPVVSSTVTSVFVSFSFLFFLFLFLFICFRLMVLCCFFKKKVYLDPWETFCVEVPVDSVFHFEGFVFFSLFFCFFSYFKRNL